MADWDPFADPADTEDKAQTEVPRRAGGTWSAAAGSAEVPPDPWNDNVYVDLAREAARLAAEQEAAAQEKAARRRQQQREAAEAAEAAATAERDRLEVERRAREAAANKEATQVVTSAAASAASAETAYEEEDPERAAMLEARRAYVRGMAFQVAMKAVREAPSKAAKNREAAIADYYEEEAAGNDPKAPPIADGEEGNFRETAAQMMAESMGIKIRFKSSGSVQPPAGLLFPDQGSRSLRLLSGARGIPAVQEMLHSAEELLGFDILGEQELSGIYELFRGPEAIPTWLEETSLCQPAMYICGLAAIEKLRARRPGCFDQCKGLAGLSLGEYAALTYAGVFDFRTCLQIVQLRGEAMQEAAEAVPQRMLSVAGLDGPTLERLCEASRDPGEVCQISQRLFPAGFVCAGHASAVERLLERARATEGCKQVQLLKASGTGGFHTPLMEPARLRLREALRSVEASMRPPRLAVYMCAGAQRVGPETQPATIIELLCDQLVSPVLWEDAVRMMIQDGIEQFYECGPMQQLKGMMKRIDEKAHGSMISIDHIQKNVRERRGPRMAEPQDVTEGPLLPGGRNRVRLVW